MRSLAAALVMIASAGTAGAAIEAGPPPALTVAGERLGLAACAEREVLWIDVYDLGLYLDGSVTPAQVRDPSAAKAVRVRVVYGGDPPDRLPRAWREALAAAYPDEFVRRFEDHYRSIGPDDTLTAAYAPGGGTTILHNGEPVLAEPGHRLMDVLLGLWIGPDPVSREMRRDLLAGRC